MVYSDGWVRLSELEFVYDTTSFFFDHEQSAVPLYEDKDGRYWMVVSAEVYKKGTKWGNCSICVSDPENDSLPVYKLEPYTMPEQEGTMNSKVKLAAVAGVCVIIIVIVVLVVKSCKKL